MAKNNAFTPCGPYPNTQSGSGKSNSGAASLQEWAAVTIATIENAAQVIRVLTEAINGKHSPLKNKTVYLRIKPGSPISVARKQAVTSDYEFTQVKEDGWDIDQAVIDSIEFVEITEEKFTNTKLASPIAYISFEKVDVDQDTNPADGFWFQLKDLEWKLS